jgi:alpha-tubulin suppressor-like RCC1 family protein
MGQAHQCALRKNGSLICYGATGEQMGDDVEYFVDRLYNEGRERKALRLYYPLDMTDVKEAALGETFTCALKKDGSVWCFGEASYGTFRSLRPVRMQVPQPVVTLSAARHSLCAVGANGEVWCWGEMVAKRRGAELTGAAFVKMRGLRNIVAAAVADHHACFLSQGKKVLCLGSNTAGQLGNGTTDPSETPVEVAKIGDATAVVVSESRTFVLASDRTIVFQAAHPRGILHEHRR